MHAETETQIRFWAVVRCVDDDIGKIVTTVMTERERVGGGLPFHRLHKTSILPTFLARTLDPAVIQVPTTLIDLPCR